MSIVLPMIQSENLATGTIVEASPGSSCTYTVAIDSSGANLEGCASVVGSFFGPLLGIRVNYKHSIGANVLVLLGAPAYIICELPSTVGVPTSSQAGSATISDVSATKLDTESATGTAANPPTRDKRDLMPGELDMSNLLGVGITWLTHLIKLQAGDRVTVECHLLNDLLRLMAENLQVITGAGSWECNNDGGRLNMRHDWTCFEHEAWGLKSSKDPKVSSSEGGVPQLSSVPETGRWRCSEFAGFLGDLVHKFVTDPENAVGTLAQDRAGKFDERIGPDGSYSVRSVSDITFERVTRVVIPIELKRPADPTGDTAEELLAPKADYLDIWKPDPVEPWVMAHHLRDYARWLSNYAGYAMFLRQKKDWLVKAESESPAPSYAAGQKDREMAVPAMMRIPRETYACIRIMRDGSIVMLNGYGSSVMMAGPDIAVSAVRDLKLEAGRNIVMTAGHSIHAKAKKNIELVAVTGALLASARARMALWCEQGTMLIRSLMKPDVRGEPPAHRFPTKEVGLIIEAPFARALVGGLRTTVEAYDTEDSAQEPALKIQSVGNVVVRSGAEKSVGVAGGTFHAFVDTFIAQARSKIALLAADIDFGGLLRKTGGQLLARALKAESVAAKSLANGQLITGGKEKHRNHVGYSQTAGQFSMPPSDKLELTPPHALTEGGREISRARPVCDYLLPTEYQAGTQHETITQQIMRQGAAGTNAENWEFDALEFTGDERATLRRPYPGEGAKTTAYKTEEDLHKPSSRLPEDYKPTPGPVEEVTAQFQCHKPPA